MSKKGTKGGRPKNKKYRPRKKQHSRKLNRLVAQAWELYPYKNEIYKRGLYVSKELTPRPNKTQQKQIDVHLKALTVINSYKGIDSTPDELRVFEILDRYHMQEIKQIHNGYYWSIKLNE